MYFSDAVLKYHNQKHITEERIILTYSYRGLACIMLESAWQQVAGVESVPFACREQISLHVCLCDDRLKHLVYFLFCQLVWQTRCSNSYLIQTTYSLSHSLDFRVFPMKSLYVFS